MSETKTEGHQTGSDSPVTKDSQQTSHHENVHVAAPVAAADQRQSHRRWLVGWHLQAAVVSVCSAGFLVFGYDQGVMSGVVISDIWLKSMGNPSSVMIGTIVAVYDIGAIFGCVGAALVGEKFGRRKTLICGCLWVLLGMLLMVTNTVRSQFMVGRVVTGVGIGFITSGRLS
jgi:MFS family permease